MNQQNNQQAQGYSVDVGDELSKNMTFHTNVKQEVILTTADKLRLVLHDTHKHLSAKRDWVTAGGLLVSFLTTLCTSDFRDAYGLKKSSWEAIFVVASILSGLWLIKTLYQLFTNWGKGEPDYIIDQIQLKSENTASSSAEQTAK